MLSSRPSMIAVLALLCVGVAPLAGCNDDDDEAVTVGQTGETKTDPKTGEKFEEVEGDAKGSKKSKERKPSKFGSKAPDYAGRYLVRISRSQAQGFSKGFRDAGRWTVVLSAGVANISSPELGFVNTLKASGKQLTFGPMATPRSEPSKRKPAKPEREAGRERNDRPERPAAQQPADPCGSARGVYRISIVGDNVRLTAERDPCSTRRIVLERARKRLR